MYKLEEIENQIFLGNCIDVLRKFPDECIDILLTDPPNFIPAKHYATRTHFRRNFSDLSMLEYFYTDYFKEIERVMKPSGILYIFCNGQSYPLFWYYVYFFTKSARDIIWNKIVSINGYSWRHQHEMILFAEMPKAPVIPTGDGDIITPIQSVIAGKCPHCDKNIIIYFDGDVINGRAVKVDKRVHPAEKPEEIIEKLILKSSKEGQIILDTFVGSGKTLMVAKYLKRKWIGIENNKEYYNTIKQQLNSSEIIKKQRIYESKINTKRMF